MSGTCCIAGGGPAGIMLGFLLARAGVPVTVLEKHADFLRDFRGDTVHPSTLQVLEELGLLAAFDRLPQRKVRHLAALVGGRVQEIIDFRGLRPFDYLALVPQWDFLNFLAEEARRRYPHFDLRMRHEALGLVERGGRVAGVHMRSPEGEAEILADVVVACDGRNSRLREAAGLRVHELGAPMDVLWFRVPREASDPEETFGVIGAGHMMVLLNRTDYWQTAFLVPKGGDAALRAQPIGKLRDSVVGLAPFLADRAGALASWEVVKTLEVRVDRLERWYRPGLLVIGDAAHAMSPIGGVGINLAIQDAVAAANALAPALAAGGPVGEAPLAAVQARRLLPTRVVQAVQRLLQRRVVAAALSGRPPRVPLLLRALLRFRAVRHLPARLFGYGLRREHVRTGEGFTMIELLVILAVVAILALMMVPSFQDRLVREQVLEALPLADIARKPVAALWAGKQALPADNAAAGLPSPEKVVSNLVQSLAVEGGAIHLTFGYRAHPQIKGKVLTLRPAVVEDAPVVPVAWICGFADAPTPMTVKGENRTDVPPRYLPLRCRENR